jgi:hypothetical protein
MRCDAALRSLSERRDGSLPPALQGQVDAHLAACARCRSAASGLDETLDGLHDLPHLEGSIVSDVLARLEVETRGPGLRLLYASTFRRRPLMAPCLLGAATLLAALVFGLTFAWHPALPPAPVLAWLDVPTVRQRGATPLDLAQETEGNVFIETVIGPDGRVARIRVLDGNGDGAKPLMAALSQDRYDPAILRGHPVAVSVFRLVSHVDVFPPES